MNRSPGQAGPPSPEGEKGAPPEEGGSLGRGDAGLGATGSALGLPEDTRS
ncbi:hypothetical protein DFR50_10936 [Roseiarcus fermentans]|uniref:Uncharacterized protein n=1 Tax=Roseiarcus fermentans TaxID=1473586 RepID=A0A366FHY4_9HYPH|nr:hypothetical protein DFR50_10936 [Roseiarcus fermentans]